MFCKCGCSRAPRSGSLQANPCAEPHPVALTGRSLRVGDRLRSSRQIVPLEEGLDRLRQLRSAPGERGGSRAPRSPARRRGCAPRRPGRPRSGCSGSASSRLATTRVGARDRARARRGSRTALSARPPAARRRPPRDARGAPGAGGSLARRCPEARLDGRLAVGAHESVDAVALEPIGQLVPAARALVAGVRLAAVGGRDLDQRRDPLRAGAARSSKRRRGAHRRAASTARSMPSSSITALEVAAPASS